MLLTLPAAAAVLVTKHAVCPACNAPHQHKAQLGTASAHATPGKHPIPPPTPFTQRASGPQAGEGQQVQSSSTAPQARTCTPKNSNMTFNPTAFEKTMKTMQRCTPTVHGKVAARMHPIVALISPPGLGMHPSVSAGLALSAASTQDTFQARFCQRHLASLPPRKPPKNHW
jgi:hypothetical protein